MLTYDLNHKGNLPIYEFLYNSIKDDIMQGEIKSGERLPSKREMAKNHNISIITVENAYAQLLVEGYIFSVEKKGYFVTDINPTQAVEEDSKAFKPYKKNWFVNFHSNHIMYDSFPFSTWSKVMRQTLSDEEKSFLESPQPNGVWELRQAISNHLRKIRGMKVNPDNIIVGAGTEYLYSIIVQLLGHNRIIAMEDPGYQKIGKVYENNGIKCVRIPMDDKGIDINKLNISKANAVHISPSHHFPTGKIMPINRRHQILKWATDNNSYIIEDDYDSEFRFSGKPIPTMASENQGRVIYLNTFSKTLAPSIRIAYMVLPDKLMKKYHEKLSFYSSTVSSFEQYTLANFIDKGYYERHINRMRNYYREYRRKILSAIKNSSIYDKVTIEEENAGLHFILKVNENIDDNQFIEILKEKDIYISSISDYCYNKYSKYKHKFIINYSAVEEEKLKKALDIMNDGLKVSKLYE